MHDPDILGIGMGPVGAWTAILLKKRFPEIKILMFEQYMVPKRNQVLHLDKSCFVGANEFQDLSDLINALSSDIQINELEKTLSDFAKSLGIDVIYEKVVAPKLLLSTYPSAKVLIGADGLNSLVRREYFENIPLSEEKEDDFSSSSSFGKMPQNDEKKEHFSKENLQYFALVNYKVKGNTRALSQWQELPWLLLEGNHMFSEHVGKESDGERTITMRCIINEETYKRLRGAEDNLATAKNPLSFENLIPCDPLLANTIERWKTRRRELTNELQLQDPMISTTILSVCSNDNVFEFDENGQFVILVGEAFAAVPFYRSINMCLQAVAPAVKAVEFYLMPDHMPSFSSFSSAYVKSSEPKSIKECEEKIKTIVSWESFKARRKSMALNKLVASRNVSAFSYQKKRDLAMIPEQASESSSSASNASSSSLTDWWQYFAKPFSSFTPQKSSSSCSSAEAKPDEIKRPPTP